MWKKAMLGLLAVLALLAANVRLYCQVTVNGQRLDGLYLPADARQCELQAREAAEEILSGPAAMPELGRRYTLSLGQPDGDEAALTEAVLRAVTGVKLVNMVYVNGERLGAVEDGSVLFERLRSAILGQMPNAAVSGNISGRVQVRRVYARSNQEIDYDDMILLITGMAPVIYVDGNGKLV